jgi:enoyl-CoA hydratase
VIAAINGPCAGAGISYTAAYDIRITADGAVFSAAYLRAGFTGCDLGSSWLLPLSWTPATLRGVRGEGRRAQ